MNGYEFSQGNGPGDVLEELGKRHKFTVTFATETARTNAKTGRLCGHVEGVSTRQVITAISSLTGAEGPLPWTATRSELKFPDPDEVFTAVHDISLLAPFDCQS